MILQPTTSRSSPGGMAATCRWAAPTSGATSSTASTSAAAWACTAARADDAAAHHVVRAKMGKTAAARCGLNADMLSPYDYWQYWRNAEDADVGRFLKLFTLLPMDEIARLSALGARKSTRPRKSSPPRRPRWCMAARRRKPRRRPRGNLRAGDDGGEPADDRDRPGRAGGGPGVLNAFVARASWPLPRPAAGPSGGLRVNDALVTDARQMLAEGDAVNNGAIKLSFGKKKHVLLKAV